MPTQKLFTDAVARHMQAGHLPGAVLGVADKASILAIETHGVSDLATQTPMTPDSVFWIASMTKPMTATAGMILVDEGKLDMEAPLSQYLPEFKNPWVILGGDDDVQMRRRAKNPILVRQLLSHTAGFPNVSPIEPWKQDTFPLNVTQYLYAATALTAEPGTKYTYSNPGLNTFGRLIEVVSGIPYDQFMKTRLLDPLGMSNTSFVLSPQQLKNLVTVYFANQQTKSLVPMECGYLTYPLTNPDRHPFPGGGYYSTAADMLKFGQLLLNKGTFNGKQFFTEKTLKFFTTRSTDPGADANYALGFGLIRENHYLPYDDGFGHGGAYQTHLTVHPTAGLVTVYLVQLAGVLADANMAMPAFRTAAVKQFGK
jgi:CubicO group peptidase (beta-lactamase class C family)